MDDPDWPHPSPDAEWLFGRVVESLAADPRVTIGRMFGSPGLKVQGKVFAMLVKGRLVVKVPELDARTLVASGRAAPLDPGQGRLMREWIAFEPSTMDDWLARAQEALAFTAR